MATANRILSQMTGYGESRETLEANWENWMHHLPFDTSVGNAPVKLYNSRISKLEARKRQGDPSGQL